MLKKILKEAFTCPDNTTFSAIKLIVFGLLIAGVAVYLALAASGKMEFDLEKFFEAVKNYIITTFPVVVGEEVSDRFGDKNKNKDQE